MYQQVQNRSHLIESYDASPATPAGVVLRTAFCARELPNSFLVSVAQSDDPPFTRALATTVLHLATLLPSWNHSAIICTLPYWAWRIEILGALAWS